MGVKNLKEFSAQLKSMANTLPADLVRTRMRLAGLHMLKQIIESSPVRTGRFRGAWQTTVGLPGLAAAIGSLFRKATGGDVDPTGEKAKARGEKILAKLPNFAQLWFTNAMPYAEAIDRGLYEPKNPATDPQSLIQRAWGRDLSTRTRARAVGGDPGSPLVKDGFTIQAPKGITDLAIAVGLESLNQR